MFDIKYSKQAVKFLKSLDMKLVLRIFFKIEKLREEPIQHDSKRIEGYKEKLFRIRVGDYRRLSEKYLKAPKLKLPEILLKLNHYAAPSQV